MCDTGRENVVLCERGMMWRKKCAESFEERNVVKF